MAVTPHAGTRPWLLASCPFGQEFRTPCRCNSRWLNMRLVTAAPPDRALPAVVCRDRGKSGQDRQGIAYNGGSERADRSGDQRAVISGHRSAFDGAPLIPPWRLTPADQPIRANESTSVLRAMPNVRQTDAFVAPASKATTTAASFSASMPLGRPPRLPRRRAASKPAFTRSWVKDRSNCARVWGCLKP